MGLKSLWFKGTLQGRGIVNYDGKDARWVLRNYLENFMSNLGGMAHGNIKLAKHSIRKIGVEDGKPKYEVKIKISSDCLRHAIFEADQPFHNPLIIHAPKVLVKLISSVVGLLRGYMFEAKGVIGVKRKSPIIVTDAKQDNDTISTFDVGTQLCPKVEKVDDDDISGLSLHYKECICDVTYEFEGAVDLNLLQFISLSQMYDRLAVHPDYVEEYREGVQRTVGSALSEKGFYIYKTATNGLPEEGLLLNQEQVTFLVREFFKRLLGFSIMRSNGYVMMDTLKVKNISDPISDLPCEDNGYYSVKSVNDIQLNPSDIEVFYEKVSDEDSAQMYEDIVTAEKTLRVLNKAEKERKKAEKASKKKITDK